MAAVNVEYRTEIQAKAEKIWDILADVAAWPRWQATPFVKLETPAPIKEGSVFEVKLAGLKWKVTVTKAERPEKFAWIGKALGLKGNHEWEFKEHEGETIATTRESVSGWAVFPLYFMVRTNLRKLDKKWLADLKITAETT
jgi:uncharacterized protein YndB with AHSA1/START domain